MTAGTTRFTTQERSVIAGAPLLAAMSVLAGEHGRSRSTLGGPGAYRGARSTPGVVRAFRDARSTLRVVRAYRDARGAYDTELLRDLLATSPAGAIHRPHDPEELIADATAALRRAMEILEHAATADERAEYRTFVLTLADAAARGVSHRALLRRNRAETTPDERATPSITRILGGEREARDAPPAGTRRTN